MTNARQDATRPRAGASAERTLTQLLWLAGLNLLLTGLVLALLLLLPIAGRG